MANTDGCQHSTRGNPSMLDYFLSSLQVDHFTVANCHAPDAHMYGYSSIARDITKSNLLQYGVCFAAVGVFRHGCRYTERSIT